MSASLHTAGRTGCTVTLGVPATPSAPQISLNLLNQNQKQNKTKQFIRCFLKARGTVSLLAAELDVGSTSTPRNISCTPLIHAVYDLGWQISPCSMIFCVLQAAGSRCC